MASSIWFGFSLNSAWANPAPPPLSVYGALPKTEDLALSPNGKLVALINTVDDQRILTVSEIDGAELARAAVGDLKITGLHWADDDHVLVYAHKTARLGFYFEEGEFLQGIVVQPSTKHVAPLVPASSYYVPAIFGRYGFAQVDGHRYGYFGMIPSDRSSDTNNSERIYKQSYPDLCRIDLDSGEITHVERGNLSNPKWAIDDAGHVVAKSEYQSDSGKWSVYRPDSQLHPVASGHADFGFGIIGLGRSNGTVLVGISDEDAAIEELRLSDGHLEEFLPAGKVLDLTFSRVTRLLQSAQVVGDGDPVIAFDPILQRHWESIKKAFPGKYLSLASMSADLNRIVVMVTGGDISGTWQLVDFAAKKAQPLADAYPDIPDGMMGEIKEISYPAADGLVIPAILTLPPQRTAHGLPLVVFPHGGPQSVDRPVFDWWAQAFASRGYAVLQPNFRGSDGYGAKFRNAGFRQWGRKMQTDVSDGIGFLASQGTIDPKRVCVVGGSYGGYVALAGVTIQHGLYRCAASYGGVSDPQSQLIFAKHRAGLRHEASATRYWEKYIGDDPEVSGSISPQKHAAEADAPILLIHGEKDTVVSIDQSEAMESALKRAGKPVEFVRLDGEDHWLSRSATRLQMLTAMVAFVEKYNPADAPSAQPAGH